MTAKLKYTDFIAPLKAQLTTEPQKARDVMPKVFATMNLPVDAWEGYKPTCTNAYQKLKSNGEAVSVGKGQWALSDNTEAEAQAKAEAEAQAKAEAEAQAKAEAEAQAKAEAEAQAKAEAEAQAKAEAEAQAKAEAEAQAKAEAEAQAKAKPATKPATKPKAEAEAQARKEVLKGILAQQATCFGKGFSARASECKLCPLKGTCAERSVEALVAFASTYIAGSSASATASTARVWSSDMAIITSTMVLACPACQKSVSLGEKAVYDPNETEGYLHVHCVSGVPADAPTL